MTRDVTERSPISSMTFPMVDGEILSLRKIWCVEDLTINLNNHGWWLIFALNPTFLYRSFHGSYIFRYFPMNFQYVLMNFPYFPMSFLDFLDVPMSCPTFSHGFPPMFDASPPDRFCGFFPRYRGRQDQASAQQEQHRLQDGGLMPWKFMGF